MSRHLSGLVIACLLLLACSIPPDSGTPGPIYASPAAVATQSPGGLAPPVATKPGPGRPPDSGAAARYGYTVVRAYPHDPDAFTQGLVFHNGVMYESTGLNGRSSVRRVDLESGRVLQRVDLDRRYFGEGLAVYGDRIVQLTYQTHVGFVYDRSSLKLLRDFTYPTEGWGLTFDGKRLVMSDGTPTLRFLDAETLEETGSITVTDEGMLLPRLNELEYIDGEVFANIWLTDRIARISPETGRVTGWIDLKGILVSETLARQVDVLNGIAYDGIGKRLFVTGKLWPELFEIRLLPR